MDSKLLAMRDLIQQDAGARGLASDPDDNLLTVCAADFETACRSIAETRDTAVVIVTGFYIPTATPPCGETDGPLGAVFLARALTQLGIRVALVTDEFCVAALNAGLQECGLEMAVRVLPLPQQDESWQEYLEEFWLPFVRDQFRATHLIALERVGPSHTAESIRRQSSKGEVHQKFLRTVPPDHHDRCHTMRGIDITHHMAPAHLLFEAVQGLPAMTSIGIGDGGNEIGMGKMPWEVIQLNIKGGDLVACRVPADHLIVAGVSNWGAYALAAGIHHLRGVEPDVELFDPRREEEILRVMVEKGPLVDGVTGMQTVTVDGLAFARYAEVLKGLASNI